jgi:hypothetical protein
MGILHPPPVNTKRDFGDALFNVTWPSVQAEGHIGVAAVRGMTCEAPDHFFG